MKFNVVFLIINLFLFVACDAGKGNKQTNVAQTVQEEPKMEEATLKKEKEEPIKIIIEKDFLYDKYTLEDTYLYQKKEREFQWNKIEKGLAYVDSFQRAPATWGILQNRGNINGEGPLTREWERNPYKCVSDMYGVERYQSVPMFLPEDTETPERYGRDGSLVKILISNNDSLLVENINFGGKWIVPKKYVKAIPDSIVSFAKVIFVDKTNQNIAPMEKSGSKWLVRSMNPATTGVHNPPYMHETPNGIFVVQEKKSKMYYLVDGTSDIAGYSPYASRFCNGGYIHGVPVNNPNGAMIEYSWSLGTIPRSHMCVRNATSHAKFIYDWAPVNNALVFVFE